MNEEEALRKILLRRIYAHGARSGRTSSLTYRTALSSPSSPLPKGIGHPEMTPYIPSPNTGLGKSLKNFLISTAARCGSPNDSSETTFPRSYASCAARSSAEEGERRKRPSSCKPGEGRKKKSVWEGSAWVGRRTVLVDIRDCVPHNAREAAFLAIEAHEIFEGHTEQVRPARHWECDGRFVFEVFPAKVSVL